MKNIRRRYTRDFKLSVLRELESGKSLAQLSREHEIYPSLISKWKTVYLEDPKGAFQGNGNTYKEKARIAELERIVGQLYAENAFLKKTLSHLETRLQEQRKRYDPR